MNKIEKIQIPNIKDTSLLVVLDSIELEKTLGYHDLFLLWSPTFQKAGIPVYIVFPDEPNQLKEYCQYYNTYIHYVSDFELIKRLDCIQEKIVFGKKYSVILSKMYVVHNGYLFEEQKRINNKAIKKLYIKALELKFENFIKKLKIPLTSQISFGNINERKRVCDEKKWRFSSVGRASALQAEGQRFESVNLHHLNADLAQLVEQLTCNQ